MLKRFAAGAVVASIVVAIAAAMAVNAPHARLANAFPLVILWPSVPALWGVWAILTPRSWVPRRLPLWGAILGVIAAGFGVLVLNLPFVIFDVNLSLAFRSLALPFVALLYFVLWMAVRRVYVSLDPRQEQQDRVRAAGTPH